MPSPVHPSRGYMISMCLVTGDVDLDHSAKMMPA